MDKANDVVFPCVPERRTPYLFSATLIPSISVSVQISGNGRKWVEIRVSAPPWSVCLRTSKRILVENQDDS
jgi:hypothetical protein